MTKEELLLKIDTLIQETKLKQADARSKNEYIDQAFELGKENGLVWAKILIQEVR